MTTMTKTSTTIDGLANEVLALKIVRQHFPYPARRCTQTEDSWGWDLVLEDQGVEFGIQVKSSRGAGNAYEGWAAKHDVPVAGITVNPSISPASIVACLRPRLERALQRARELHASRGPITLPRSPAEVRFFFNQTQTVAGVVAFARERQAWSGKFRAADLAKSARSLPCSLCGLRRGHKTTFLRPPPRQAVPLPLTVRGSPKHKTDLEGYCAALLLHAPVCQRCHQTKGRRRL